MFCKHCGKEINDAATFCRYCGKPVVADKKVSAPAIDEHAAQIEVPAAVPAEPASPAPVAVPETPPHAMPAAPVEEAEASVAQSESAAPTTEEPGSLAPAEAEHKEKSKKKTGLVIALIAILVIVAAVAGFFIWKSHSANQTAGKSSSQNLTESSDFPLKKETEFYYIDTGSGNRGTDITIEPDGSFKGYSYEVSYADTNYDMTVYRSEFSGKFASWDKISAYEYKLHISNFKPVGEIGKEEVDSGTRTVISSKSPLADVKELQLYLPGMVTDDLPVAVLNAGKDFGPFAQDGPPSDTLPIPALYDTAGKLPFFQTDSTKKETSTNSSQPTQQSATIYTPAKGTTERQALMDAARIHDSFSAQYVVNALYSNGEWAIGTLKPDSVAVDPSAYIWHKAIDGWVCAFSGTDGYEEYVKEHNVPQDLYTKWSNDPGFPSADVSTSGFWGIWLTASKNKNDLAGLSKKLTGKGYANQIIITNEWSNLNPETWYAVCVGPYGSESAAKADLSAVRSASGVSDAYVKFSGTKK